MKKTDKPLTSAEKKRRYRQKMKEAGYKEIGCWIDPRHSKTLREFAATLPKPQQEPNSSQTNIFDVIDGQPN